MENEQLHEVEETTETAAQGAIDVSENKGVVKFEENVNLPVIPETLMINGVELNLNLLTDRIAEIKKMKIDGITDEAGYNEAVKVKKEISKLRTSSEAWRKKVMSPVLKFGKDLKGKIDSAGTLCEDGEKHLDSIIKPIEDFIELERQKAELEKDRIAEERAEYIVSIGGVLKNGTYNFEHDGGIFILAADLRSLREEDYQKELADINNAWQVEQDRLQAIKDAEEAEQNKLKSQLEDLNAERTEFRKEQLEMKGYALDDEGKDWFKGGASEITEEQIITLDASAWKLLLNPPIVVETPVVETISSFTNIADDFAEVEEPKATIVGTKTLGEQLAELPMTSNSFAESLGIEEKPADETVFTRTIVFTKDKPWIEAKSADGEATLRLCPTEMVDRATEGLGEHELTEMSDKLTLIIF